MGIASYLTKLRHKKTRQFLGGFLGLTLKVRLLRFHCVLEVLSRFISAIFAADTFKQG